MCTHIVYAEFLLDIERNEIKRGFEFFRVEYQFERLNELKVKNPQLKVLIRIFLLAFELNQIHVELLADINNIKAYVRNVVAFLQQNKFDGIIWRINPPIDVGTLKPAEVSQFQLSFLKLVKEMKTSFMPFGYFLAISGFPDESRIGDGRSKFLLNFKY